LVFGSLVDTRVIRDIFLFYEKYSVTRTKKKKKQVLRIRIMIIIILISIDYTNIYVNNIVLLIVIDMYN